MAILVHGWIDTDSSLHIKQGNSRKSRFVDEIMRRVVNGQYYSDPFFVTAFVIGLGLNVTVKRVHGLSVGNIKYGDAWKYTLDNRHVIWVVKY